MAELTWLGHSCFRLRGREATIVFDPASRKYGSDVSKVRADIVTVSHHHPGHDDVQSLKQADMVIDGPGEYEVKDVFITGVRTYHDNERGARHGFNTVYVVTLEDMVFCHLGDLGHSLTSEQLEQIGSVDVLMVPIAGETLDPVKAVEVISQIEPGLVVPMHFRAAPADGEETAPADVLDKFRREIGHQGDDTRDKLTIRKTDIPEQTQVVVLTDLGGGRA